MTDDAAEFDGAAVEPDLDAQHPWPGLLAFGESDRQFFFGRAAETNELLGLVVNHRLTVLYGASGLGKTSLLTAGLFPRLRDREFLPVHLRLDVGPGAPAPSTQVKAALLDECRSCQIEALPSGADESIWEYLHGVDTEFWSSRHRLLTPVLVFDQFEEIFSRIAHDLEGRELRGRVVDTLGDLAEGRVPLALKASLAADASLAARLDFADHRYRMIVAIREDYLADLDELAGEIPGLRSSRMRLTHMRGETAADAVFAAGQPASIVTAEVAKGIVSSVGASAASSRGKLALSDLMIEPALLSVVCRELNEARLRQNAAQITFHQLDDSASILKKFYEEGVKDSPEALRRFIEDRLITSDGVREMVAFQTMVAVPGVTEADISRLIDRRILRTEYREGRRLLELTHDRLTPVIQENRDRRLRREEEARDEAERQSELQRQQEALELSDRMRLLAERASSGPALRYLLASVIDAAVEVSGAERGFIMLSTAGELEITMARGRGGISLEGGHPATSRRVTAAVFATRQILVIPDLLVPDPTIDDQVAVGAGIRNVVCLPLLPIRYSDRPADLPGDEAPTGVLYLDSRDPGAELSSSARIALESLARQAAMAIQNAEVYGHVIEKARLDHEMYIAAALQQALLPTGRRRGPYYAAAARSVPCRSIGGDFFDYVELSGDALGIAIGDVAGKGPPAALLSMLLQGIFAGLASSSLGPAATLERVNQSMYRRATESRFASLFYGVLFADGRFTYSNAGNSPPLLVNRQDWRRLESDGLVVGLFERALYEEVTVRLQPGDVLIIFTDGVSEAIDPAANEFGEERIVQTVREAGAEDPDAVLDHLLAGLYRFTAGATQSDDITAMVVRYLGLS